MGKRLSKHSARPKKTALWIFLMCLFFAELLAYTWSRVQCVRIGYDISKAAGRRQGLMTDQNNLKIELARLKSPRRIEKIAEEQIGLTTPSPNQVIIIP